MTKDEALKLALEVLEDIANETYDSWTNGAKAQRIAQGLIPTIKEALAQQEPRNFCSRCGKRTADLTVIHTCTPPRGLEIT